MCDIEPIVTRWFPGGEFYERRDLLTQTAVFRRPIDIRYAVEKLRLRDVGGERMWGWKYLVQYWFLLDD